MNLFVLSLQGNERRDGSISIWLAQRLHCYRDPFMAHDRDRITSGRFEVKNIVLPAGIIIAVYCGWNFKRIIRTLL